MDVVEAFVGAAFVVAGALVEEVSAGALAVVSALAVVEGAALLIVLERTLQRLLLSRFLFAMGAWSM